MKGASTADFGFESYKITQFQFTDPKNEQHNLSVDFIPSGKFIEKDKRFILDLIFTATYGDVNEELLKISVQASFVFNSPILFEDIPPYFYSNSIAIIFPYLRAFVSTLTTLAMVKPVILPVLNLTALTETFRENSNPVRD